VNLVVRNTTWVPGHFHLTVGTAVALPFFGLTYWLLPHLTGRAPWAPRLGVLQAGPWTIGVLIMSRGLIMGGLLTMPRRTAMAAAPYFQMRPEWATSGLLTAVGGTIMFVGGALFILILIMTWFFSRRAAEAPPVPVAAAIAGPPAGGPVLEGWGPWVGLTVALVPLAHGPYLLHHVPSSTSPDFRGIW
jgi:cytochrome c oxidase subunit I